MTETFTIRPASTHLAPMLAAMHAESFGLECWSREQMIGSLALTTTKAWVAYEKEMPSGFILCQAVARELEILTFCVIPARRRQRIGEMLLRYALNEAFEANSTIFLEVAADNMAARQLYEKFGFAMTGKRANYYKRGAVTVDAVRYEKTEPV